MVIQVTFLQYLGIALHAQEGTCALDTLYLCG